MPLSPGDKVGPSPAALMDLKPGDKLGDRYQLLSKLGEGGMGEVWKARDTELDRDVAVKVSKSEFTARFKQEARTIAAFNHENICQIYDVGSNYIVMELIDGVPLKGPLPVETAVAYAGQILDALDAAHRKGFTHRDLKPANVMVTKRAGNKTGIKLLDFGLAKQQQSKTLAPDDPTVPPMTKDGQISGTLQYMSPEQLNGKDADARSDIFAFGCVLYEMLSGKKAFSGSTTASVIAAIMEREPEPLQTTPPLDRVIRTCLAKDPDQRFQTAVDLKRDLLWATETTVFAAAHAAPGRGRLAWIAAAVMTVAAAGLGVVAWRAARTSEEARTLSSRTIRFPVSLPESWKLSLRVGSLVISPDGTRIAFVGESEGKRLLWVRSMEALNPRPLAGTEGAFLPFWSPDSRFLAFFVDGKLKKIDPSGGSPVTLCDAVGSGGGAWSRDGVIVFGGTVSGRGLFKVSASGGIPTPVSVPGPGENSHVDPVFLPDGRHFIYQALLGSARAPLFLGSLDSSERKLLLNVDATNTRYSQGHLLFLRESTLMAQPFDMRRLALSGEPFPVAEQINMLSVATPYGVFSVSNNGVLVYQSARGVSGSQLAWFDRSGKRLGVLGDIANYSGPELSPDGKRVAVSIQEQSGKGRDIWIYDVGRGLRTRFTFDPADELMPLWSPDGGRVVFASRRKEHMDLYHKDSGGLGAEQLLLGDNVDKYPLSWSPDGRLILYGTGNRGRDGFFVMPVSKDHRPSPLLNAQSNVFTGKLSPDGRWIAYASGESGRTEIYIASFAGPEAKLQVSTAGGTNPRWSHDGAQVYFVAGNTLMAASVNGKGSSLQVGAVKPLFPAQLVLSAIGYPYDVSPDGQRFLINQPAAEAADAPITVVVNWVGGLIGEK